MKRAVAIILSLCFLCIATGCGMESVRPESYGRPEQTAEVLVKAVNLVLDDAPGLTRNETARDVARFFISDSVGSFVMEGVFKLADSMHEAGCRAHLEIAGEAEIEGNKAEVPLELFIEKDGRSISKDFTLYEEKSNMGFWYCTRLDLW